MQPRLAIIYKNFAAQKGISHIGLGVSACHNAKTLNFAGVTAEVWAMNDPSEICYKLRDNPDTYTHVVISAPWVPGCVLLELAQKYPRMKFAVNSHSNVGFLQADSRGVRIIREAMRVEGEVHNFNLSGNSRKFCSWVTSAYGAPCTYLPNMYFVNEASGCLRRPIWQSGTLRIGAFGATRPQKNFMSAAGAALLISRTLKADTELWVSAGRTEGGGEVTLRSVREMLDGVPNIRIVESQWSPWSSFKNTVGHMHLLLQPSYTESFNMVTADGADAGVPSVVSDAITWAPPHWQARVDDVEDIARVGLGLLRDANAAYDGLQALKAHNADGLKAWENWLFSASN